METSDRHRSGFADRAGFILKKNLFLKFFLHSERRKRRNIRESERMMSESEEADKNLSESLTRLLSSGNAGFVLVSILVFLLVNGYGWVVSTGVDMYVTAYFIVLALLLGGGGMITVLLIYSGGGTDETENQILNQNNETFKY